MGPKYSIPLSEGGGIPSKYEVMFNYIADLVDENCKMANIISQKFIPNPDQRRVLDAIENSEVPPDEWIYVLLVGPTGSGKSTVAYYYVLDKLSSYYNAWALGVRTTSQDIKDTIYKDAVKLLQQYGVPFRKNDQDTSIYLPNGSVWRMRSDEALMDSKSDKSHKLGSTSYNMVVLEEADSLSEELVLTIPGRMRNPGHFRKVIFLPCNPPSKRSWIYKMFYEGNDPDDPKSRFRAFYLSAEANTEHVGEAYIKTMRADFARNPALAKRLGYGLFGPDIKGIPYFQHDFRRDIHVSDTPLQWDPRYPMIRSWDFGLNTALVVFQYHEELGQIRFHRSIVTTDTLLDSFCDEHLPKLYHEFPGARWEDYGDIAGRQRSTLSKKTAYDVLADRGIYYKASKQGVMYGLNVISRLLRTFFKGKPMIFIDPCCELLIEAFESGYCNKKKVTDHEDLRPNKDGVYDHCVQEGTPVFTAQGWKPIEQVVPGELVHTRLGLKPVIKVWDNGTKETLELVTTQGSICATPEHRVWTQRGWVQMDALRYGDICATVPTCLGRNQTLSKEMSLSWMVSSLLGIPTAALSLIVAIMCAILVGLRKGFGTFTDTSGRGLTERSLWALKSTIKTVTLLITTWTTSRSWAARSTADEMRFEEEEQLRSKESIWTGPELGQMLGTSPSKGEKPTAKHLDAGGHCVKPMQYSSAPSVERLLTLTTQIKPSFALSDARLKPYGSVVSVNPGPVCRVYDLTVADAHEYLTPVGVVHNCMDAVRYGLVCMRAQPEDDATHRAGWGNLPPGQELFDMTTQQVQGLHSPRGVVNVQLGGSQRFRSRI